MTKEEITKINHTLARSDDQTIQITFTIPAEIINKAEKEALKEIGQEIEVPGFRKGKAPIEKVKEKISKEDIVGKILTKIFIPALREVFEKEKIQPIIQPKIELVSTKKDEDWQIRVITCEMPQVNLENYREKIINEFKPNQIWTPEKGKEKTKEEPSREEKEQKIMDFLLRNIKIEIPKLLIEEEVDIRLSQLLERIEKLGLDLEKYLQTIGKTANELRSEYEKEVREALSLEIILNQISNQEKLSVTESEVDELIKASSANDQKAMEELKDPEKRSLIKNVLLRRKALEYLTSLI